MSADYRYPGPTPFQTFHHDRFFCRTVEIKRLLDFVHFEKHVLLFSESGAGKTSLINAGLFPQLTQKNYVPIKVHFNVSDPHKTPLEIVRNKISNEVSSLLPLKSNENVRPVSLWEGLNAFKTITNGDILPSEHGVKTVAKATGLIPILIFDQFEDFFSFQKPKEKRDELIEELANVLNGIPPKSLVRRRKELKAKYERDLENPVFLMNLKKIDEQLTQPRIKLLFSIKSSELSKLDELAEFLPEIFNIRFELKQLTVANAKEAIVNPGLISEGEFASPKIDFQNRKVLQKILNVLTAQDQGRSKKVKNVDAFQLQLICNDIESRIIKEYGSKSSSEIVEVSSRHVANLDQVIKKHYLAQIEKASAALGAPRKLRGLIEESMIVDDRRNPKSVFDIRWALGIHDEEKLNYILKLLEDGRVLRKITSSDQSFYIITHDSWIKPIKEALKARKEEELKQAIEGKYKEENQKLIRARYRTIGISVLVGLALLGFAWYIYYNYQTKQELNNSITFYEAKLQEQKINFIENFINTTYRNNPTLSLRSTEYVIDSLQIYSNSLLSVLLKNYYNKSLYYNPVLDSIAIKQCLFIPNRGENLLIYSKSDQLVLWDDSLGRVSASTKFNAEIDQIAVSKLHSSSKIAVGLKNGEIHVGEINKTRDNTSFNFRGRKIHNESGIAALKFHPVYSDRLLTVSRGYDRTNGKVIMLDIRNNRLDSLSSYTRPKIYIRTDSINQKKDTFEVATINYSAADISPDGKRIVLAGRTIAGTRWMHELEVLSGSLRSRPNNYELGDQNYFRNSEMVASCYFLKDNSSILITKENGEIMIIMPTGSTNSEVIKFSSLVDNTGGIKIANYFLEKDLLTTAMTNNEIALYKLHYDVSLPIVQLIKMNSFYHEGPVNFVDFNNTGTKLLSSSMDKSIRIWPINQEEAKYQRLDSLQTRKQGSFDPLLSCAISREGNIALGGNDNHPGVYLIESDTVRRCDTEINSSRRGERTTILEYDAQSNLLVGQEEKEAVFVFKKENRVLYRPTYALFEHPIDDACFAGANRVLISCDTSLFLWDDFNLSAESGALSEQFNLKDKPVSKISKVLYHAGTDQYLVTGGNELFLLRRNFRTLASIQFQSEISAIDNVMVGQTSFIGVGTVNGAIFLCSWEGNSIVLKDTVNSHLARVNSIEFSKDNRFLSSASADNSVKLWELTQEPQTTQGSQDAYRLRELYSFDFKDRNVTDVAFTWDGAFLLTVSSAPQGRAVLFPISAKKILSIVNDPENIGKVTHLTNGQMRLINESIY